MRTPDEVVVSLASTGGAARIYTVNGGGQSGKSASAWLEAKIQEKRGGRKKGGGGGTGGEGEIRLIQDFDFPEASNKIATTRDGQYAIATGTYKPRMKVFDLEELSMKTERTTDSENVDFCILSSDWTKTLHLQSDRSIELHTQSKAHYSIRTPKQGRALSYHFPSCDALVGGRGNHVYRLNLELGRFMKPFALEGALEDDGGEGGMGVAAPGEGDVVTGVNAIDINPAHQLLSFGTETMNGKGTVEMWDPRSRTRAGLLRLPYHSLISTSESSASLGSSSSGVAVTALASQLDGLNLAVGTSTGHVLLYDLRSNKPYTTKDQGYGLPIKKIQWIQSAIVGAGDFEAEGGYVASTDEKVVKVWGRETGTNLVSINPPMPINDMHVYPKTGLMFLANEAAPMTAYYIPQLGPAPKWCRFLDNMTEEMEEGQEVVMYDDYKFVDRQELDSLNLTHLIGTDTLKPYMHGFFIDLRLYTKARAIANPFAYAEHRERLVRERLEKEQESRIRGAKQQASGSNSRLAESVKVNRRLAKKIANVEEQKQGGGSNNVDGGDGKKSRKRKSGAASSADTPSLLTDSRFGDLFTNPDFEIDEHSREFQLLNPSTKPRGGDDDDDDDDDLRHVPSDSADDASSGSDSDSSADNDLRFDSRYGKTKRQRMDSSSDSSDDDNEPPPPPKKFTPPSSPKTQRRKPALVIADDEEGDQDGDSDSDNDGQRRRRKGARPNTLASYEERATKSFGQRARELSSSSSKVASRSSSSAATREDAQSIIRGTPGGGMEMSFVPSNTKPDRDSDTTSKADKAKKAKAKRDAALYGAGLENRGDNGGDDDDDKQQLRGEEASGRQRMRKGVRSASNNVVRQLKRT